MTPPGRSSSARDKFKTVEELKPMLESLQKLGRQVVFANGCFDLLHVGHVRYLQAARAAGDLLVVALNGDRSVRELKGPGRPLLKLEERVELVAALECVDYVVSFDEPTADAILDHLRPDVHAKGTDYTEKGVPEAGTVLSYGGRIAIVGDPKDHSTRDLLRRIADRH